MADPGFPRGAGGMPTPEGDVSNLLFCNAFAEYCMKMKEFGPTGAGGVGNACMDLDFCLSKRDGS